MLITKIQTGIDKELLLNLYIRLKNDFDIMNKSFEYSSGMYNLNLCRVLREMKLSSSEEDLVSMDMFEYRTEWIGMHWFRNTEERIKFLEKRIEELRKELSVVTYNSKLDKNKEISRYILDKKL